jgi:hypothetical protein
MARPEFDAVARRKQQFDHVTNLFGVLRSTNGK